MTAVAFGKVNNRSARRPIGRLVHRKEAHLSNTQKLIMGTFCARPVPVSLAVH
jgi:hypothetical protein